MTICQFLLFGNCPQTVKTEIVLPTHPSAFNMRPEVHELFVFAKTELFVFGCKCLLIVYEFFKRIP